jgi:HK97 family phage portal protein
MNLRSLAARVLRPLMSYADLEERAFSESLRRSLSTGVSVTEQSALWQAPVWACVRVISESLSMLRVEVIEASPGQYKELNDHLLVPLLNVTPDGEMPAFNFRETLVAHALLWGNAYAEIERDLAGRPYALHLLTPDRVEPVRRNDGALGYDVRQADGRKVPVAARDMLHIKGLGFDGLRGYSVVALAQQSLGLNAATETFAGAFFGNGMQLGTTYTTDASLKPDQMETLRGQLEKLHKGASNAFRAAILTNGLKPAEPPMPLKDAQFVEGRRFGVLEVCRWFRVPPHLVMELERATHSNVEQEQIAFVQHCLAPWAARIEGEMAIKLLGRNEQARREIRHDFDDLVRGDLKSRYEAYQLGRQAGFLSVNEIREREDMTSIGADGDIYLVPANMTTPEKLLEPTPAPVFPPVNPAAQPDGEDDPEDDADPQNALQAARERMHLVRTHHGNP